MGRCHLCVPEAEVPDEEILVHLAEVHGYDLDSIERWPDGEVVIHDESLTPEDFGA